MVVYSDKLSQGEGSKMQKRKLTNIPSLFAELGHLREVLRNLRLERGERERERGRERGGGREGEEREWKREGHARAMRGHASNGGERLSTST